MKVGIAIYHANAHQYKESWIKQCFESLHAAWVEAVKEHPTYDFSVYELNYGSDDEKIFCKEDFDPFQHVELRTYAHAMNYIYNWMFNLEKCDIVANVNIDDYYAANRFNVLLDLLQAGADIASSNYILVDEEGREIRRTYFAALDVGNSLHWGHNIVSNPCHMMKRHVFEKLQFNPDLVPVEDLDYWQRCIKEGFKISIAPEYLHYYRVHPAQSGNMPI